MSIVMNSQSLSLFTSILDQLYDKNNTESPSFYLLWYHPRPWSTVFWNVQTKTGVWINLQSCYYLFSSFSLCVWTQQDVLLQQEDACSRGWRHTQSHSGTYRHDDDYFFHAQTNTRSSGSCSYKTDKRRTGATSITLTVRSVGWKLLSQIRSHT